MQSVSFRLSKNHLDKINQFGSVLQWSMGQVIRTLVENATLDDMLYDNSEYSTQTEIKQASKSET